MCLRFVFEERLMMPAPTRQTNDGWLTDALSAARAGSADALGRLLDAFRPYLLLIANHERGIVDTRLPHAPSDFVASAFLRAIDDFDQFRGQSAEELAGWLRTILLRHIIDLGRRYRAEKRCVGREFSLDADSQHHLEEQLLAADPAPERSLLRDEDAERIRTALEHLPGSYAQVIVLRDRDSLPFEEVGRRLGRSTESARKLHYRALKQLRALLGGPDVG
jgi:RNA polymerase sigma-70 factor (ECF subfamily)